MRQLLKKLDKKFVPYPFMCKSCHFYNSGGKEKKCELLDEQKKATKIYQIVHKQDVINFLQNWMTNKKEFIPQEIMQILQFCSKNKYRNDKVTHFICSRIKHNIEKFSLIRLCVCVNYLINLNIKRDKTFIYVVENSLIKKLKNNEHLDLHGICLIAKFILRERITNITLIFLLSILISKKINTTCNSYDLYNLVVSLMTIQNEGLLSGYLVSAPDTERETSHSNEEKRTKFDKTSYATDLPSFYNTNEEQKEVNILNEENVHALLRIYINSEQIRNGEIVLIINTLTNMNRNAFFHKMNLTKNQRVQLYETLLSRINYEGKFDGKIIALLLFNLQKMLKLNEISERILYATLTNMNRPFKEVIIGTILHAKHSSNLKQPTNSKQPSKLNHMCGERDAIQKWMRGSYSKEHEQAEVAAEQIKATDEAVMNDQKEHTSDIPLGEFNPDLHTKTRTYFNLQEIGMVLQFYGCLADLFKGTSPTGSDAHMVKREKIGKEEYQICHSNKVNRREEKQKDVEDGILPRCDNLCVLSESYINALKESLFFYTQRNDNNGVKMNILDFCTLLKGFSKTYKNTVLDRDICSLFENFLMYNEKRINIKELKMIIKLIFENKNSDIFPTLCNTKKCLFFNHLHNILLRNVLNESSNLIKKEKIELYTMCFYYLSFLHFNHNSYFITNNFIMKNIKRSMIIQLIPYIIISKFNYHKLEMKMSKMDSTDKSDKWNKHSSEDTMCSLQKNINVRYYERKESKNGSLAVRELEEKGHHNHIECRDKNYRIHNFDRIHILYKLMNQHFDKYKTFYVLNCLYMLTKYLKNNKTICFPLFSNFHFPDLFHKLNERFSFHDSNMNHQKGHKVTTNYDYFINYVKYNYCLSFLCHYINLTKFLTNVQFGRKFPYYLYTPFNAYLTIQFLTNYEQFILNGNFISFHGNPLTQGTSEINTLLRKIKMEKVVLIKNMTTYVKKERYNLLTPHDIIHMIKTFKFVSHLLNHGDDNYSSDSLITFYTCMSNLASTRNVKTTTSFELLTEFIKFLYHFEFQNRKMFEKYHDLIVNTLICAFKIVFKNLPYRTENNYLGMLQFSLLYMSHFVRNSNLVLSSLSLYDLKKMNHFICLSLMNLEKYQQSCTFQLQILKVLRDMIKREKRIINEYRVENTPYTVDILIK
ncbi:hypothetical protein, conserved [Plasmodium gonderi]|uniref:Uncharacterized protein n=1 Tax=Plasmodium gonderi TaxID=77519 RepID=A0A1Y1JEZ2_PLAGO|nr:hypothetical protein, conserved [Plasmodium gonderi]GAW81076.1 hypothetical protein, conserved [Plasmodium gonderi]